MLCAYWKRQAIEACLFCVDPYDPAYDGQEGSPVFEYLFTFHSITLAQRGFEELRQKGIFAELIRSPKQMSSAGCAYALRVNAGDGYVASAAMKAASILPVKTLRVYRNGDSEVVRL